MGYLVEYLVLTEPPMFPGSVLALRHPLPASSSPLQLQEGASILLAESDEAFARALATSLRGAGHCVDVARSGREVLPLIELYRPDLLIMDLDMDMGLGTDRNQDADLAMQDLNVFTCVRQLKRMPGRQGPRVLALTAHGHPSDRVLALHAGCDRLLFKPLPPERLVLEVQDLLGRSATSLPGEPRLPLLDHDHGRDHGAT
ncbi:MAG: hypothetical protein U1A78_27300 [Polyangia bacterium]